MLLNMIATVCMAMGDGSKHCDIRVLVQSPQESMVKCDAKAEVYLGNIINNKRVNGEHGLILAKSAECFDLTDMKSVLNAVPTQLGGRGFSYEMSFY